MDGIYQKHCHAVHAIFMVVTMVVWMSKFQEGLALCKMCVTIAVLHAGKEGEEEAREKEQGSGELCCTAA